MCSPFDKIIPLLNNVHYTGPRKASALCPGHEDKQNSLSVSEGDDVKLLLKCYAGCEIEKIVSAVGLTMADLFKPSSRAAYRRDRKAEEKNKRADVGQKVERKTQQPAMGCTLAQYASSKHLPEGFLTGIGLSDYAYSGRPAVKMAYRDADGAQNVNRYRIALGNDGGTGSRFLWEKGSKATLYGLWLLPRAREKGYVVLCEGESDAQTLWYHDIPALGIPGASMWKEDWAQHFDSIDTIFLVVEPDQGGQTLLRSLVKSSLRPRIRLIQMAPVKDPSALYLSQPNSFRENWAILLANALDFSSSEDHGELDDNSPSVANVEAETKKTVAQRLIEIGNKVMLFRSERDEAFACFPTNGHSEVWPVRSKAFRKWLSFQFYSESSKPPNSQAMEDALYVLEAMCDYHGETKPLSLRMAQTEDGLWLDLSDSDWRAVRITAAGWSVESKPPPIFRRYAPSASQVLPKAGGDLSQLRRFVNVDDESLYRQLVVWLIASFFPTIAHPILVVYGEQGSAKSTLMRLLAMLVDPSKVPLRSEPRDIGEWVQAADHAYMVTLDNVSNLRGWLSDALCRAVTGEGFTKRRLYSDDEDMIIEYRRVISLTGIEVVPERADLFDRGILTELQPILPENRRTETEVISEFEEVRPDILGGLLDVVAGVLRELPMVRVTCLPRMADFARIGVAVERVLKWPDDSFMSAYAGNIAGQHEEALSSSVLGEPLQMLMKGRSEWLGTAKELLDDVSKQAGESVVKTRDWPKSPRSISGLLRRMAPNLRASGLDVEFTTPHGKRLIVLTNRTGMKIRTTGTDTVPTCSASSPSSKNGTQASLAGTQRGSSETGAEPLHQKRNGWNAEPSVCSVAYSSLDEDILAQLEDDTFSDAFAPPSNEYQLDAGSESDESAEEFEEWQP